MRLHKFFAATTTLAMILAAAPKSPSALTATCQNGSSASCTLGDVTINGVDYPHNIDVEVIKDNASLGVDSYTAPRGAVNIVLDFSGSLDAGSYTVNILDASGKDAGTVLGTVSFDVQ